jgi:DNA-binding CsgD family transcriptional regulator
VIPFEPPKLSEFERITLSGLAAGLTAEEIAAREGWRHNYAHTYAHRAKRKLKARNRIHAVAIFVRKYEK